MQQSVLLKLGKATLLNLSSSRRRSRALSRCATLATIATSSTVAAESQFLNSTSPCSLDSLNMSSMLLSPGFWRSRQQQPQSRHSTRTLHTSTRVWGWGCWSSLLYCGCIVVGAAAAAAPFRPRQLRGLRRRPPHRGGCAAAFEDEAGLQRSFSWETTEAPSSYRESESDNMRGDTSFSHYTSCSRISGGGTSSSTTTTRTKQRPQLLLLCCTESPRLDDFEREDINID